MSETSSASDAAATGRPAVLERHHFLLRRLHSASGIVPIGVFLCEHLFTNVQILRGAEHFDSDVHFIHSLPALRLIEIFGIWLPIAFHAALGVVYTFTGRPNTPSYPYQGNVRYTLQRVTGMLALVFIFVHLWTVQWGLSLGSWHTPFDPEHPATSAAAALQFAWWVAPLYTIGMLSCVYHFANGLWTAAITWGLTISTDAQRRWGYVCLVIGIALALMGLGSINGFRRLELQEPPTTETVQAVEVEHQE